LSDTAVAAQLRRGAGGWTSLRRGSDYYPESLLIWLEADTIIRQNTRGKRSLDDFCRAFHGGPGGEPSLKTYTFNDVVTTLNAIAPYNWAEFFTTRINTLAPRAPLGGITGGGWQLVYEPERSDYFKVIEQVRKSVNLSFSIGLTVDSKDGTLLDVVPGLAAANAGLAPDMKLVAVNGRTWTPDLLRQAVAQTKTQGATLELLVTNRDYYHSYRLDYQGGEKYPQLVRQPRTPDLVSAILQPLTR
jgi:predicted metalloprotease with PDZ domain